MNAVCVVLHVHQPCILRPADRIAAGEGIFDIYRVRDATHRLHHQVLAPAVRALRRGIDAAGGQVRVALAVSGLTLDLLERHAPDGVAALRGLVATGAVELLATPYAQSTMLPDCPDAFVEEIIRHQRRLGEAMGQTPAVFWNSLGWIDATVADAVHRMGLPGAVTRMASDTPAGIARLGAGALPVVARHARLTGLVEHHFADRACADWPITADRFAEHVQAALQTGTGSVVGLIWPLRMFGEQHAEVTGIFDFLQYMLPALARVPGLQVAAPRTVCVSSDRAALPATRREHPFVDVPEALRLPLQRHARQRLLQVYEHLRRHGDAAAREQGWGLLDVDHLRAMAISSRSNSWARGPSGYEAYLALMQACDTLTQTCESRSNK